MAGKIQYSVKFVGYGAYVIARKYGREVDYAMLDFVSGSTNISADGGFVIVSRRVDLGPFVKQLPDVGTELRHLLRQHMAEGLQERVSVVLSIGRNTISVARGTDVDKFIRQITKRYSEIEQLLAQAEQIGSRIKRRPYADYIGEIERDGLARVEAFGFGLFISGKLIFYPDYQVGLVRPVGKNCCEVHATAPETTRAWTINAQP